MNTNINKTFQCLQRFINNNNNTSNEYLDSPGVPTGATKSTMVATYNDLASVEAILKANDCAAVILEPGILEKEII